jgi:hypothetical protein
VLAHFRPAQLACVPDARVPPDVLRYQLAKAHGVRITYRSRCPTQLATMIRTWTRTHQHEDLHASLTTLENALGSRGRNA